MKKNETLKEALPVKRKRLSFFSLGNGFQKHLEQFSEILPRSLSYQCGVRRLAVAMDCEGLPSLGNAWRARGWRCKTFNDPMIRNTNITKLHQPAARHSLVRGQARAIRSEGKPSHSKSYPTRKHTQSVQYSFANERHTLWVIFHVFS